MVERYARDMTANMIVKKTNFRFITTCKARRSYNTYKTAKCNFINSGALGIIRIAYCIHISQLMKLIFALLYVSSTMGPLLAFQ